MAQMAISCLIERVPSKAEPADAPRRWEASVSEPQERGELGSLQQVLQMGQVLEAPGMSIGSLSIK